MKTYRQVLQELERLEEIQSEMETNFQSKLEASDYDGIAMNDIGILLAFLREEGEWIKEMMGWQDIPEER